MGADSYRVEVLHFLHPHLLWVEVENKTNPKDILFEQIGVYGVLPQEVTLSDVTLEVDTQKCEKWMPAASLVMKKALDDAIEVWFSPTFIDRRWSIFDDNIHKYGELVVKKKNGKIKVLSQQLIKSGFAIFDTVQNETKKNFAIMQTQLDKIFELIQNEKRTSISMIANDKPSSSDDGIDIRIIGNLKFPIETKEQLDALENKLFEQDVMNYLVKKFSETCGTSGFAKISKIGLPLMKRLIKDELLNQFTWKGIKGSTKMAFVHFVKIRELFYKVAHLADKSCSFTDSDSFIQKSAIKHSGQRMKRHILSSEREHKNVKRTKEDKHKDEIDETRRCINYENINTENLESLKNEAGLFHQELSAGMLKTRLSPIQTQDVVKHLENSKPKNGWGKAVKKKTTLFHKAQQLESMLTVDNLKEHEKVQELLKYKIKDFDRCKDIDEESVGRAARRVTNVLEEKPSTKRDANIPEGNSNSRKLELIKNKAKSPPKQDTEVILNATKLFLEKHAVKKDVSQSSDQSSIDKENSAVAMKNQEEQVKKDKSDDSSTSQKSNEVYDTNYKPDRSVSETVQIESECINDGTDNTPVYIDVPTPVKRHKAKKKNKSPILEYDINKEVRVAYGPPGLTPTQLNLKIVAKDILDEDKVNLEQKVPENDMEPLQNKDMFDGVDSELNIQITNKDSLKKYLKEEAEQFSTSEFNTGREGAFNNNNNEESNEDVVKKSKKDMNEARKHSKKEEILKKLKEGTGNENILKKILKLQERRESQTDSSETNLPEEKYHEDKENNANDNIDSSYEPKKHPTKLDSSQAATNKSQSDSSREPGLRSKILRKKLNLLKEKPNKSDDSSSSDIAKDSSTTEEERKATTESDDDMEQVLAEINQEYHKNVSPIKEKVNIDEAKKITPVIAKNNVNPFKNLDDTISVFVDKLVTAVLMVHTKMNKRIQPCMELRDVNFNTNIHVALTNMSIKQPMMIQSVSWFTILRGYSLFMVSPLGSGKTLGYLPAVCRLVTDYKTDSLDNEGPSCIIVCATAKAASDVEKMSKMFLGLKERVLACYTGMNELKITTTLLNGCDLLICTPSILVRLMQMTDFGVDLRRLSTFVLDDCERLSQVYINEVKFFLLKIKEMLKARANKEWKVQIIAASRLWCDFMGPLAKKAPNSVVCIGAFQECVLYSKANTTVTFVKNENKINTVLDFIRQIDGSKMTVIVCRENKEVEMLEKCLIKEGKIVFACDNNMTVHDLYNLSKTLADYQEPILGPILVCCDGNLTQLNVTNAHYLVHFSLPHLFSMFCKRFAVLNDNYPSIFKTDNENIKIQVLLEDSNVEQLPKILNFVKRCTDGIPPFLDDVCTKVLAEKDAFKAKNMVPLCDNLMAIGECPDFWNCQERHAVIKENDVPKDWMPKTGIVTFEILHYHTAVLYSVRLLSNIVNGQTKKFPQTYSTLSLKMGMYYSKESNKKLHGVPKVGDVCAVSVKLNFFARCQVVKILSHYKNGNPSFVLVKLLDEEKYERCSDVYLYYMPDELKNIETHVIQVRLANIKPKDKDVTFSDLATSQLKKITDKQDVYMRGKVSLALGNCVFVDTLVACQDLTSLNETIVKDDFRKILLDIHATPNPEHVPALEKLCREGRIVIDTEENVTETPKHLKEQLKPDWAHLDQDQDDLLPVYFATAQTPDNFFVRLVKFDDCMNTLIKDIEKHVKESPEPLKEVRKGVFVIAKFPDDDVYERARIDEIYDENKVKCFFVDQGDWRDIPSKDLLEIPERFLAQMPCQAIECRLAGVLPAGESWTEFASNWFCDRCLEDDIDGNIKQLYIKFFTKEIASHTEGNKYGVVLIDTNGQEDVLINQLMIDNNLAQENEDEIIFFEQLNLFRPQNARADSQTDEEWEKVSNKDFGKEEDKHKESLDVVFAKTPIRSINVGDKQEGFWSDDRWDVNFSPELTGIFSKMLRKEDKPNDKPKSKEETKLTTKVTNLPAIKYNKAESSEKVIKKEESNKKQNVDLDSDDLSSAESAISAAIKKTAIKEEIKPKIELRKPKVIWRQNDRNIIIKIQLIGVEKYDVEISDRSLKFETYANDTNYGFDIELYGVIDSKSYIHSNKGQYILIILSKMMKKNWLNLTRDAGIKKWIAYDIDSIDTSSDEEEIDTETIKNIVKNIRDSDTDSDDDFVDDAKF